MKSKLSGAQLAQIMTEVCPRCPGYLHCFRQDPDSNLEVKCYWCGMEIDFNDYTCSRNQATRPDGSGTPENSPAAEWLDLEFHSSKAFDLPKKSGLIESSLFWYYVDSHRDIRVQYPQPEAGKPGIIIKIPGLRRDLEKDPPREIETRDLLTRIKRIYIDRECILPPGHHSLESYCSATVEPIAHFNVQKLIAGRFKAEHEAEALAEIENQLQYIDRECHPRYHNRRLAGKAIFVRIEQYKAARGLG